MHTKAPRCRKFPLLHRRPQNFQHAKKCVNLAGKAYRPEIPVPCHSSLKRPNTAFPHKTVHPTKSTRTPGRETIRNTAGRIKTGCRDNCGTPQVLHSKRMPAATILFITDNQNLRRLPKTHGISNKQFRNYFILLAPRHQLIGILGLRRDDGHLFRPTGISDSSRESAFVKLSRLLVLFTVSVRPIKPCLSMICASRSSFSTPTI